MISLCSDSKDLLLIGTKGGELIETKFTTSSSGSGATVLTPIMQAHNEGELWGVATKGD